LKQFADIGAEVTGEVGDARPIAAIADALLRARFDGIILSTLPPGRSEWLRQDLPARVARRFGLPVQHVVATRANHEVSRGAAIQGTGSGAPSTYEPSAWQHRPV
jgi:hypothetical protein